MDRNYKIAIEKRRFPDDFSSDIIHDIKLVNFGNFEDISPYGSFALRLPYPGDVDLVEDFKECCTVEDVINKFSSKIKVIMKNIEDTKDILMTEFKMGLDERYNLDVGKLSEGVYVPNPQLKNDIHKLKNKKLINSEQEKYMIGALDNPMYAHMGHLSSIPYDLIREELRKFCILRWSETDVERGFINLPLGKKMTIKQALHYKTDVKIDLIDFASNTFVEITNYILLIVTKDGRPHYIVNRDHNYSDQYIVQDLVDGLKEEIEKLFYSKIYFNPFKGAKRLFALARHFNDNYILEKIFPLLDSGIAQLYQIKSELAAIRLVLDIANFNRYNDLFYKIISRLQQLRNIIPNILEISHELDDSIKLFEIPRKKGDSEKNLMMASKQITELIERLLKVIDKYTMKFLSDAQIYPIMRNYLPIHLSYIPENGHTAINYPKLHLDKIIEDDLSDITTETESSSSSESELDNKPKPAQPDVISPPILPDDGVLPAEDERDSSDSNMEDDSNIENESSEGIGLDFDWRNWPDLFGDDPGLLDTLNGVKKKDKKGFLDFLEKQLEDEDELKYLNDQYKYDNDGLEEEDILDNDILEKSPYNQRYKIEDPTGIHTWISPFHKQNPFEDPVMYRRNRPYAENEFYEMRNDFPELFEGEYADMVKNEYRANLMLPRQEGSFWKRWLGIDIDDENEEYISSHDPEKLLEEERQLEKENKKKLKIREKKLTSKSQQEYTNYLYPNEEYEHEELIKKGHSVDNIRKKLREKRKAQHSNEQLNEMANLMSQSKYEYPKNKSKNKSITELYENMYGVQLTSPEEFEKHLSQNIQLETGPQDFERHLSQNLQLPYYQQNINQDIPSIEPHHATDEDLMNKEDVEEEYRQNMNEVLTQEEYRQNMNDVLTQEEVDKTKKVRDFDFIYEDEDEGEDEDEDEGEYESGEDVNSDELSTIDINSPMNTPKKQSEVKSKGKQSEVRSKGAIDKHYQNRAKGLAKKLNSNPSLILHYKLPDKMREAVLEKVKPSTLKEIKKLEDEKKKYGKGSRRRHRHRKHRHH
jgi:hypothetical protein